MWVGRGQTESVEWELTLTGREGQQLTLSYEELLSLSDVETTGGYFSSVGVVYRYLPNGDAVLIALAARALERQERYL